VLFGFFVYPGFNISGLWLSIFFLPNVAFISQLLPSIIDPIWSIGIEEQFYIFHPHFFRIKKVEYILYALVGFIVFFFLAALFLRFLNHHNIHETVLNQFFYYARYDDMVIGAIVAVIYFNTKHPTFKFRFQGLFNLMFNKKVQVVLLLAFLAFTWVYITYETPQGDVILSVLSALLIVNLCEASTSIYSLNNKMFQFAGKISYGIYLLHKFPLFFALYLVNRYFNAEPQITKNIMVYAATIVLAIGLASLSYYGYERYFLQLKKRFQKITQ
jgi:peptidoglycan/LPS O-acetylase OafA/YrhL